MEVGVKKNVKCGVNEECKVLEALKGVKRCSTLG